MTAFIPECGKISKVTSVFISVKRVRVQIWIFQILSFCGCIMSEEILYATSFF